MTLLAGTLERCRRAARLSGGSICIGASGGKDSAATIDTIVRSGAFTRIELFAMYLVDGLELFESPVRRAAARYGLPVHFVPHWDLARLLKNAVLRPHIAGEKITLLKLKDVERALTKRLGIEWFAYGERASDSIVRRIYTRECNGVQEQWKRCWPIFDWKVGDVRSYLALRRIPLPQKMGARTTSGISLEAADLAQLKKEHPADYRKILEVFPWCEAQIFRFERGDFAALPQVGKRTRKKATATGNRKGNH